MTMLVKRRPHGSRLLFVQVADERCVTMDGNFIAIRHRVNVHFGFGKFSHQSNLMSVPKQCRRTNEGQIARDI